MNRYIARIAALSFIISFQSTAADKTIVSLKGFCDAELKMAGIELPHQATVKIRALGGGERGWTYKSDRLFAYGWIINADTRELVWKMDVDNTSRSGDNREFDGSVTLDAGAYEVYFTAYAFGYHTMFTHFNINIDHRENPLFRSYRKGDKDGFWFFKSWWSEDIAKEWEKRCKDWGLELLIDESKEGTVRTFTPPKQRQSVVVRAAGLGDSKLVRQGFSLSEHMTLEVYALGEGTKDALVDYGWIVDRQRVWEMRWHDVSWGGGAKKNVKYAESLDLPHGEYVLYFVTDNSHSCADWNDAPPDDPLNWGITISATREADRNHFKATKFNELQNVIVSITRVGDSESRTEGFTLKRGTKVRVYAFGERSNERRLMADYGMILDAKTRQKAWTMDVDRTQHAGGASKNRYIDEVIDLPKGSYLVMYNTDDSHAYNDWNSDPPFDEENYGITVMGVGADFNSSVVGKYVEERDKSIIAQIATVGNGASKEERFKLDRTTRIRVYAIGEGEKREMFDYGWIEDAKTGNVVWEMTYSMTFHAGGGRKNRMVNTTILLDRGEYKLRYVSDDSHSFGSWNVDPPEDQRYWGITLYKDEGLEHPNIPVPPEPPE